MIDTMRRLLLTHAPAAVAWSALAAPETGAAATPAAAVTDAAGAIEPLADGYISFADAADKLRALFRFERDLRDEGMALSTYQFLVYALPQGHWPSLTGVQIIRCAALFAAGNRESTMVSKA
jgi:hypothetical protein